MFSALNQGSLVHILDKTNGIRYTTGEVIGVTQPGFNGQFGSPSFGNNITLKVKVDGDIKDYPDIPSSQSVMSYNNGGLIISETKQGIQSEVESFVQTRKIHLDNIEKYKQDVMDGEEVLKQINPEFAKDKERDDRINCLDDKVKNIDSKLDKILEAMFKQDSPK